MVHIANIVSALVSWRISKQVYRFNMDLERAWFFVYYNIDQHGTDVLKFPALCRNGQEVAVRGFELLEGKNLRECMAEVLRKRYQREYVDDIVQEHMDLAEKILQLVLYICSVNADIQPVEPKSSGTLRRFEDIKDWYFT